MLSTASSTIAERVASDADPIRGSTMQLSSRSSGSSGGIGYLSNAPATIALAELAAVGCLRWTIEEDFELAKGEVGLDHYEVTKFRGWYHHITLSLLALAFLKAIQREWGEKWSPGIRTGDPSAA